MVSLDTCDKIRNTLGDLPDRIYVTNKKKAVNLKVFNMITRINESKSSMKHISSNYKYRIDSKKNVI